MIAWLTDTLVMTGALMALILLVRRPVGRWFGPGAAYALWALPMIRLLLPPLVLPQAVTVTHAAQVFAPEMEPVAQVLPVTREVAMPIAAAGAEPALVIPWTTILVTVWLTGAALFLMLRIVAYRRMRAELLRQAHLVGHAGKVRIVESVAVDAPVAFGVLDRVVALPRGFLAGVDSDTSDFAITHELEHHAGNDLIANMAVQPLFALHWFNPLAWAAWRAMRSDQEAACDCRVMAGRTRRERERYGRLIASFAAGSRFALAAPMAGPLKGDKPIIHRLKALVRNEVPERHRLVGRTLFALSVLGVPLTATVTYAAVETPEAPEPPEMRQLPQAPAAPLAPEAASQEIPETPETPETPHVPEAPRSPAVPAPPVHAHVQDATALAVRSEADAEAARSEAQSAAQNAQRLADNADRMAAEALRRAPRVEQTVSRDGKVQTIRIVSRDESGERTVTRTMVIDASCPADRQPPAPPARQGASVQTRVCTGAPDTSRHVAMALAKARAAVAANRHMPADVRADVLADLDDEIADARDDDD